MNLILSAWVGRYLAFALLFVAAILYPAVPMGLARNQDRSLVAGDTSYMANERGYVNLRSLQSIDSLPSVRITSMEEAERYVRQVAELCGVQGPILAGELLPRLAKAELAAAQDPTKLVSDGRLAEAFNFLSTEFRVPHPQHVTGDDILQFRIARSAMYPHVFSPRAASGSRPVEAVISLQQLVFDGGVLEGARKFAQKDPQPGSFKVDASRSRWVPGTEADQRESLVIAKEYRMASATYFGGLDERGMRSFVDSVANIMAFPAGR